MRHLVKGMIVVALLMMVTNCQKEELHPLNPATAIEPAQLVLPRSTTDEVFSKLIDEFRAVIQALIEEGILRGTNGNGILNRLDNIEKKFLRGQMNVALNMLQALIAHVETLYDSGVVSQEVYEMLMTHTQAFIDAIEGDCIYAPTVIAINGVNVNLPPSGTAVLPPELFVVYSSDKCGGAVILSFSQDVNDQFLPLDCAKLGTNAVQVWATNPWGNQDYAQTYINVQDNFNICDGGMSNECAPIAIAYSMLAVEINALGTVTISAAELDAGSIDACGSGNLSFSVRRAGDNAAPAEAITFNWEDAGMAPVELWVNDGTHSAMVQTQIWIQDIIAPI